MSAFLALWNRSSAPVDLAVVDQMLAVTVARAVDGTAVWQDGAVALAHQHFWVTPEAQGEVQPLVDERHSQVIAADARLDNREELGHRLGLSPSEVRSLSDAWLILLAYQTWAHDCVQHLLGDFAFVIWDGQARQLFAARDPLGMRDLCYYVDRERCVFASDVEQILAHPEIDTALNEREIVAYLDARRPSAHETLFADIYFCAPAHCLLVTSEGVSEWRYWELKPHQKLHYRTHREYADHFATLLREAVAARMRCAGTVGVSLSGGLDSTALTALAAELMGERALPQDKLLSFSYVFDRYPSCDERRYIEPLVARYGLEATYISGDRAWPLSDFSSWPIYRGYIYSNAYGRLPQLVAAAAESAGCRVLLTGMYGDHLFYCSRYWAAYLLQRRDYITLLSLLRSERESIDWRQGLLNRGVRPLLPSPVKQLYRRWRPRASVQTNPGIHERALQLHAAPDPRDREPGTLRTRRYTDLFDERIAAGRSVALRISNGFGFEQVDPYRDRRLLEFIMAIPGEHLGLPGNNKRLLRSAVGERLPAVTRARQEKTNFSALFRDGLLKRERETVRRLLKKPEIVEREYVDGRWLEQELAAGEAWSGGGLFLWLAVCLELWLQKQ